MHAKSNVEATPKRPIQVVFLILYYEAWDSLALVFQSMIDDPRFEPIVATIPRKLTGDAAYGGEKKAHKFLKKLGVEHIRLNDPDPWQSLETLKKLEPDYVFLNYPWQRNYQPPFRPDSLVKFTRILYTPYFLAPLVNDRNETFTEASPVTPRDAETDPVASHLYTQRIHQLASLIFVQDQATKSAFALTERGAERVHFTGSPKLDSLRLNYHSVSSELQSKSLRSKPLSTQPSGQAETSMNFRAAVTSPKPEGKRASKYALRVLWAPHHSYSPAWLNFGTFANCYKVMLQLAEKYQEVQFVLRPHPFLFGTLVDRGVLTELELTTWRQSWRELKNTKTNSKANFVKQFATTDLLLTDGISFLAEYPLITGNAGVFLENSGHWPFNKLGTLAASANYKITKIEDFEQFIANALGSQLRESPLVKPEQLILLRQTIDPHPGSAAAHIVAAIAADFEREPDLVDPSLLSELAWEDQPGREPRTD